MMIEDKPIPWQELLEVVFRRRWLILVTLVFFVAGATGWTLLIAPRYRAEARILLTEQAVSGPREEAMSDRQVKAELAHLQSHALVRKVLETYAEKGEPLAPEPHRAERLEESLRERLSGILGSTEEPTAAERISERVSAVAEHMEAEAISGTNVIAVAYTGFEPEWSAHFVNDLLDHHINRIVEFNERTRDGGMSRKQRNLLAERWDEARAALQTFRRDHGASLLAGDESHLRRVLSDLEANRVAAQTNVLELRAKVDFLSQAIQEHPDIIEAEARFTEDESVRLLRSRILEMEIERSELLSRYRPTSKRVEDIERRIEEAKVLLSTKQGETLSETMTAVNPARQALVIDLVQSRAQVIAAEARVQALDTQVGEYRTKLARLENAGAELERLINEVESARDSYQAYLQKAEEARSSAYLDEEGIVNLSIFESAIVPVEPEPDKKSLILLGGFFAGLVVGLGLAFLRDWMDPTVKSSAQAFRLSGVPVIAEIPLR